ncbi:MAG: TonB-dependent receptor [Bacteroidia bacterium]|nr:TonB-dependent receptor [Bacteroidia bacterium]
MRYNSAMTALSFVNTYSSRVQVKWIASAFVSNETEHYDIEGGYAIDQLDNQQGSGSFGQSVGTLGLGYFINHARNDLYFSVINFAHQGWRKGRAPGSKLTWGAKYQIENITDVFKEWKYSDSAAFGLVPNAFNNDSLFVSQYISSKTNILNNRLSGFLQNQNTISDSFNLKLIYGARINYSSLNSQTVVSPRIQMFFEPNKRYNLRHYYVDSMQKKNIIVKAAFGYYYQPPFYREMRKFDGTVNTNLKAQRSIHYVSGAEWEFKSFGRPFKFSSEAYYKKLDYMVPYLLDNIRIRYYGDNTSTGYATGFDTRVNGEFIKGLESWFTFSFLKTDEKIKYVNAGKEEVETGFLRRPTDRRVSAAIMFRDELPGHESYRMNLSLFFGSGLPYYLGGAARYNEGITIPAYKRVDIGFSKVFVDNETDGTKSRINSQKRKRKIQHFSVNLEVFNLLQINNVVSYIWVKDFQNNVYGVPNYLTGRRLNLRFILRFN